VSPEKRPGRGLRLERSLAPALCQKYARSLTAIARKLGRDFIIYYPQGWSWLRASEFIRTHS
ncbi:hypothetical protein PM082_024100, partial [Marasmius tenuissimus]